MRTASQILDVAPEEVTQEQRSQTKAINFGIIYGSSAFGIARQLGISQSQAREHIRAYFARYPGVRAFLDGAIQRAREKGYAETLDGRRRYLPDLQSRNRAQRAAAAMVRGRLRNECETSEAVMCGGDPMTSLCL